jgi:hypothetical protein
MQSIKNPWPCFYPRLSVLIRFLIAALIIGLPRQGNAAPFEEPVPPFFPSDAQAACNYTDAIRRDFDLYARDVQAYLRCLDEERSRTFDEARDISNAYREFLGAVGN